MFRRRSRWLLRCIMVFFVSGLYPFLDGGGGGGGGVGFLVVEVVNLWMGQIASGFDEIFRGRVRGRNWMIVVCRDRQPWIFVFLHLDIVVEDLGFLEIFVYNEIRFKSMVFVDRTVTYYSFHELLYGVMCLLDQL